MLKNGSLMARHGWRRDFILMCDRWKPNNLRDSRYVWLPIELDAEKQRLMIRYCRRLGG